MKFLNPCIDVAFKKIFGSEEHKRVTISFLNSILEYKGKQLIKDVQFLNIEQHPYLQDKKENYLDILCTDGADKTYIIEIQVENVKAFGKRIVFYGTKTYALQLGAKQSYHHLEPVIAIAVLGFTLFPTKKKYKSIHKILDIETHENDLQELTFAFVELPKFNKTENELVSDEDKWLYFLKNIDTQKSVPAPLKEKEFGQACHAVERMTWSEAELNAYDDAIIRATDLQGALEMAEIKGKTKVAQNLLKTGKFSIEDITQATGLSIDEIEQLKRGIS